MFHNALDQPDLRSTSLGTALSAQEIKLVLDTFLFSNRNVETILDRDVLPLLFSFDAKGKSLKKRNFLNHFWSFQVKAPEAKDISYRTCAQIMANLGFKKQRKGSG